MDSVITDNIKQRLASLGYTYTEADAFVLGLITEKVSARICHACNITTIPAGCMDAEITDAVCGEFLAGKKATGTLSGIELEAVVKAITEGDTKVEFATGTTGAADAFDAYMKKLSAIDPGAIIAHRKLVW
jgi:hypothetical protein